MSRLNGVNVGGGSSDRDDGQHVDCFVLTSTLGMGTEYTVWVDKETMRPLHGEAINGEWFDIDENKTSEIYAAMLHRILSDLEGRSSHPGDHGDIGTQSDDHAHIIQHGPLADFPTMYCWSCSDCNFGWHHSIFDRQFSYCPNCGKEFSR